MWCSHSCKNNKVIGLHIKWMVALCSLLNVGKLVINVPYLLVHRWISLFEKKCNDIQSFHVHMKKVKI